MFATCRAFAVTLVVVVACGGPHDPPTDGGFPDGGLLV